MPSPISERRAIALLERLLASPSGRHVATIGIGDDAAVLRPGRSSLVWTVDACMEGVHFRRSWLSLADVGSRSLHAAASDLAAMGARPLAALSSLVLPRGTSAHEVRALGRGQARAARELACPIVGGNVSAGPVLGVTVTVLGWTREPIQRSGARPGDEIWLIGPVGLARAGLELLRRRRTLRGRTARAAARCVAAWRRPRALIRQGLALRGRARAAIDVSDGLAGDVGLLAAASGVRAVIEQRALRRCVGAELRAVAAALGASAIGLMLEGGEDYALVATGPPHRRPVAAKRIGRIERGHGARLEIASGAALPLGRGFDHFRTA